MFRAQESTQSDLAFFFTWKEPLIGLRVGLWIHLRVITNCQNLVPYEATYEYGVEVLDELSRKLVYLETY